ncbi:oligopeptide ABC transporter ATP-binding protein, partial [Thermococcus aggregans]
AVNIPPGCRFHPRCLYMEKGLCDAKHPQLVEYEHNHWAECHLIGKY